MQFVIRLGSFVKDFVKKLLLKIQLVKKVLFCVPEVREKAE